jgi:HD-GYP domain-containing protein (c-di-GMP phosphodiesterase class II)
MNILNYQEALKNAAKSMVRFKNPSHLMKMITRYVNRNMGVRNASFIILDHQKNRYIFVDSKGEKKIPLNLVKLDIDNPLIRWFLKREQHAIVNKDYLSIQILDGLLANETILVQDATLKKRLLKIRENMMMFHCNICVPGYYKQELLGILLLGAKRDNSFFSPEEISFFQTLASDASMTVKTTEYQKSLLEKIQALEGSLGEIQRLRERDKEKYLQTIFTLAQTVDARDPYTYGHSEEIERLGMFTADEMGMNLDNDSKQSLSTALRLHDVGKLGVPDDILHKKGELTPDEWFKMKEHVRIGARILEKHDDFKEISSYIMHHHENYDGSGYPYGLKGEEIPIQSRIIAVVDSFHAMVSDRPYRKGLSYDLAVAELKKKSGTQFDPRVVEAFLRVLHNNIKPNVEQP